MSGAPADSAAAFSCSHPGSPPPGRVPDGSWRRTAVKRPRAGRRRTTFTPARVVAIDAPHHGDRPKSEEFDRIAAGMRAGMAAGEDPAALVAGMHGHLAPQAVADWQAVLTAVQRLDQVGAGPVGYRGMSMGCGLGVPLIAAEPRIRAAVLGLLGVHGLAEDAARITVPVRFLVQWDDRMVPRDQSLALFDALSSTENYVLGQELRVTILTSAEETEGRHDLTDSVMPPGAATPLHLHTAYEERLWVVSGSLTVWAGEATVTLRSGDFYTIPLNTSHAIASGPEGARALNISSPAGFAELIARAGTPLHLATDQTELDVDLFNAVAEELGDRVMGPPGTTPADLP